MFAFLPRACWRLMALLLVGLLPWAAQASMNNLPLVPTRFALCSKEAAGLDAQDRQNEMRQCLSRRYQAERILRKDCKQAVRALRPAPKNGDERFKIEQQCYLDNLSVSYKDLPGGSGSSPALAGAEPKAKVKPVHDEEEDLRSDANADEQTPVAPAQAFAPAPPVQAPVFVAPASLEEVDD